MSHFTVMVVGEDYHKELEPFDENIEENPYITGEVDEYEKQRFLDYYAQKDPKVKEMGFDKAYKIHGKSWNNFSFVQDADGNWQELSTYNPNSKWDWYELGGRWSGLIKLKKGAKSGVTGKPGVFGNKVGIDQARKKDIANWDELGTFAYLINGEWIERGEMGWWGMTKDEKEEDEWNKIEKEIKAKIDDNELISIVDCHI